MHTGYEKYPKSFRSFSSFSPSYFSVENVQSVSKTNFLSERYLISDAEQRQRYVSWFEFFLWIALLLRDAATWTVIHASSRTLSHVFARKMLFAGSSVTAFTAIGMSVHFESSPKFQSHLRYARTFSFYFRLRQLRQLRQLRRDEFPWTDVSSTELNERNNRLKSGVCIEFAKNIRKMYDILNGFQNLSL